MNGTHLAIIRDMTSAPAQFVQLTADDDRTAATLARRAALDADSRVWELYATSEIADPPITLLSTLRQDTMFIAIGRDVTSARATSRA